MGIQGTGYRSVNVVKQSAAHELHGVEVMQRKRFNEDPQLVAELKKLQTGLADGSAVGFRQGLDTSVAEDRATKGDDGKPRFPNGGFPTQFKYELGDDKKLSLSVYTVLEGRGASPEDATTTERAGSPFQAAGWQNGSKPVWEHSATVFGSPQDDEPAKHLKRSGGFDALMKESKVSIAQVADYASRFGTVYRVEPEVIGGTDKRSGRPVFNVTVLTKDGHTEQLKLSMPTNR